MNKLEVVLTALGVLAVTAVILAWPTQWLWNNALVGAIDGINPIGFWQALGLMILANVLFRTSVETKK